MGGSSVGFLGLKRQFFNSRSAELAALTIRHGLPAAYQYRELVAAGGLMSYGGSVEDSYRLAGAYTGWVLKGENQPTYRYSSPRKSSCSSTLEPPRRSASASRFR